MNKKLIIILSVIIALVIATFGYMYLNKNKSKNVVSINGENISQEEFKFFLDNIKVAMKNEGITDLNKEIDGVKQIDVAKERALESIVGYKLGVQEAKKANVQLTEEENAQNQKDIKEILKSNPSINESLKNSGLSLKEFERINMEFMLANKIVKQSIKDTEITDQQAKDYYEKNIDKFTYEDETVRARHILIKTIDESNNELPKEKLDAAKKLAEEVLKKAKANEDFAKLAEEYSEDEGSKSNGGEYTFARGQMVEEFENTAFSLNPGQISDLVKTKFGYHIIKLEEKFEKGKTKSFEEVVAEIKNNLYYENQNNEYNKLIESWKSNSKIVKNDKVYNLIM